MKPARWLARALGDVAFPPVCVNCHGLVERDDSEDALRHVCAKCAAGIEFAREPCCPTCGYPFYGEIEDAESRLCEHCEGLAPVFTEGRTAVLFKGAGRALVHDLKYHGAVFAARDIGALLKKSPRALEIALGAVLVPVPLHPRKERQRGYNQARLIAEHIAKIADGARVEPLLRRVVDTVSQTALDRATRRANLRNAFALARGARERVDPALNYVLVDDVFTTGSTLNSCARVLRRAGCARINILTFAHG